MQTGTDYEEVIGPVRGWFSVDWAELFRYTDLISLFIRRDSYFKFRLMALGCMWFFFTPHGPLLHPNIWVLALPVFLFQGALIAIGAGLWFAIISLKNRDFHGLLTFITQVWLYATPIIYPASRIPHGWRHLFAINPMT